jgi:NAD(P)H-dependent FMN reductase
MRFTILSLSASETSVGRSCIPLLRGILIEDGHQVGVVDLRDLPPVWVDDRGLPNYPQGYRELDYRLRASDGVWLVHPIYCWSASSAAKAVTEIIGGALERMPVAFLVAAGSIRSHLAVRDLMASMAFEQQTICFPKHVVVTKGDLNANGVPGPELEQRIQEVAQEFIRFAQALQTFRADHLGKESA